MVIKRKFTYRGAIRLTADDLMLVRQGRKSCTIRLGEIDVAARETSLVSGAESIRVRITRVKSGIPFSTVGEEDIRAEGLSDRHALENDLRRFYGPIEESQPVTVIYFEPIGP